jgi:excisionase family DNA binding protein
MSLLTLLTVTPILPDLSLSVRPMPGEDEPLLPTGEVAKRLGVTTRAVDRWVTRGLLTPAVTTPGGRYRFRWSEVVEQMRAARERDE